MNKTSVLFVCLGNICRSPLGQGIFEHLIAERGLTEQFKVDSCGTGAWHEGEAPHGGSIEIAKKNGVSIENQIARKIAVSDLNNFDWIIAMDRSNLRDIKRLGEKATAKIHLLREFDPMQDDLDVPDPYYSGGFEGVFDIVDRSCRVLLDKILLEAAVR